MRLIAANRAQEVAVLLGMGLLVMTIVFPYTRYRHSAGFPRGDVVIELFSKEIDYDVVTATSLGRGSYFESVGIVPCWNVHGKSVLWPWVATQAAIILLVTGLTVYLYREPQSASESPAEAVAS